MDEKKLKALAAELAKGLKTKATLTSFPSLFSSLCFRLTLPPLIRINGR